MALRILRHISACIVRNGFFTVMADECTDIANKEQFAVCIRWVDESLTDHEVVIGVYNVGTIDADTLTAAICDVLLRMSLTSHNAVGSVTTALQTWPEANMVLLPNFEQWSHVPSKLTATAMP